MNEVKSERMNNLVEVKIEVINDAFVVSSRQVAENFDKRHDHVLRDISTLKDLPNFGEMFQETEIPDSYGRPQRAYYMNRDGFSLLAMGFTGKEALEWKLKYIQAFNTMEKAWNTPEQVMARALKLADKTIESLREENAALLKDNQEMKPSKVFADAVATSKTSILIGELAKILKQNGVDTGEKRLFEWLRQNGYLISRKGTDYNAPTQRSMELGLFEVKETAITHTDGHVTVSKTTKISGKGQRYFINKFLNPAQAEREEIKATA